jgi:hypothetical protein
MALFKNNPDSNVIPAKEGDEYKRTQTKLVVDNGDAPSGKKLADPRLPKRFKYQFGQYGGGNGYIVIPKGRIVSLVPDQEFKNFDDNQYYNALTLANGGEDVTEENHNPELDEPGTVDYTRVANKPVGVAQLNVYQNIKDNFQGNIPSFITRNTISVPYFNDETDADKFDWGCAYGGELKPGDRVKPDQEGRFVKWKEYKDRMETFSGDGSQTTFQVKTQIQPDVTTSDITVTDTDAGSDVTVDSINHVIGEIILASAPNDATDNVEITYKSVLGDDLEQKVGTVTEVNQDLVPAGWLKWVKTENPLPNGEENDETGYESQHLDDEGYPYDPQYADPFANDETRPTGLEGLHDGSAMTKSFTREKVGEVPSVADVGERYSVHTLRKPLVDGTLRVYLEDSSGIVVMDSDDGDDIINFVNEEEGLVIIELTVDPTADLDIYVDYDATGQTPGIPSNLNWEGVIGSVDVLLQL